jgi:hypothetical protein
MSVMNARVVGHAHNGYRYGSLYFPAGTINGKAIGARTEFNLAINRRGYTNGEGQFVEGRLDVIRVVAWNSKSSQPGKGLADILAKILSTGKEITFEQLELQVFDKRLFYNGQPVPNPATGQPYTYQAISFIVRGDFHLGNDSEKLIGAEESVFATNGGQLTFGSRQPGWSVQGSEQNTAWKQHLKDRMNHLYDGQAESYGYARVIKKEGLVTTPNVNVPTGTTPTQAGASMPGAAPGTAAGPAAAPAATPV